MAINIVYLNIKMCIHNINLAAVIEMFDENKCYDTIVSRFP